MHMRAVHNLIMNPEYQNQARRLSEFRQRSSELQNSQRQQAMTSDDLIQNGYGTALGLGASSHNGQNLNGDPLIYPGLYSPSGHDIMKILINVRQRPNPTYELGAIDDGAALVLCDAEAPDFPIIYCTLPFQILTGYTEREVLHRNCRFLQFPPVNSSASQIISPQQQMMNMKARVELKEKISKGEEAQVRLVNYRKDGSVFENILTIIPTSLSTPEGQTRQYFIGFQAPNVWVNCNGEDERM
ncbi:hypothetical protein BGZ60DRAFT_173303 [Tricladium varicosporioides]|nr:hypothetical protein BGZ60DRAFT_173303 [Hymenoscyphus varicosporioides]